MTELITVRELARYLRVNNRTVYRMLRQGKIPATKVAHLWRFDKSSIDEWLRQRSVGGQACILVVDDEEIVRLLFKETLEELGHNVLTAKDAAEGLTMVKREEVDLVFLDLKMVGMNGAELFDRIKAVKPHLPIVIITGYPDSDVMTRVLARGPLAVMVKPFSESDIVEAVNRFVRTRKSKAKGSSSKTSVK